MPRVSVSLWLSLVALLAAHAPARAEGWTIEPFVGLRLGGQVEEIDTNRTVDFDPSGAFGLTVGRRLSRDTLVEGSWSHQSTSLERGDVDIRVDYLHLAGVYEPYPERKSGGYVLASAGVTLFDATGATSTTNFSVSAGGGGRFDLSQSISLKLQARLWGTLTSGGAAVFCSGGCLVAFSGTGVFQLELSTGVVFDF